MTEETIRELWRERDGWILRARELGETERRLRNERLALLCAMNESISALKEREDEAFEERHECYRRGERIYRVIEMYDERLQH